MSVLTGPAVEAALADSAATIVRDRPFRALWLFLLPGLTGKVFREAAIETGLLKVSREFGDLWTGPVSGADMARFRHACLRLTGQNDPLGTPLTGPAVDRWRGDLGERMAREGVDPCPELQRPLPVDLRRRIDEAIQRLEAEP